MSTREKPGDIFSEWDVPWIEEVPGEPFRYRVESKTDPSKWHLVDLTERGGHGMCDCEHFTFTANPNFRRHLKFIPYAPGRHGVSECRHIRAAFEHYHQHVTQPMLSRFKNGF